MIRERNGGRSRKGEMKQKKKRKRREEMMNEGNDKWRVNGVKP